jgi:ABC-type transport system involved in multi-copper enzyme maturation permease subunit
MIGPVVYQEMLLGARRNKLHVLRWVYAAGLILYVFWLLFVFQIEELQRATVANRFGDVITVNRASAPEVVGARFAETFVSQQMLLLALLTPAFVAGAITDEKRSGTLQYLLTAGVATRPIILGKLLGRVSQVALVALAGLPLFALLAGFGGLEPITLLFVAAVLVLPLFAIASATLLASVLCRQTRDAVLALYVLGIVVWLLLWWTGLWEWVDPLHVLAPVWGPSHGHDLPEAGRRLLVSALAWGPAGLLCLGLAVWQLRPAYMRELQAGGAIKERWYSRERIPVDDHPVHWRERNVEGLAPTPALRRIPRWLGITAVALAATVSSSLILYLSLPANTGLGDLVTALASLRVGKFVTLLPDATTGFFVQGVVVMLLVSMVVGIRCSGAVSGEREKGTWEALLLTPLSAKELIRGKLWGIMGSSYWYLLAYAACAIVFSVLGGLLAFTFTVLWLVVSVLAMYFLGATGLWASTNSKSSWASLVKTILAGYLGGVCIYVVVSPGIVIIWLALALLLLIFDAFAGTRFAPLAFQSFNLFFVASCVGLALIFWLAARILLSRAQRWVADRERTRHWYDEPIYRRPRRPRPIARTAP